MDLTINRFENVMDQLLMENTFGVKINGSYF